MFFLYPQEAYFGASWMLCQLKMRKVRWCCSSYPSKTSVNHVEKAISTAEGTVRPGYVLSLTVNNPISIETVSSSKCHAATSMYIIWR